MSKIKRIIIRNIKTAELSINELPREQAVKLINAVNQDLENPELRADFTSKGRFKRLIKSMRPKFTAFTKGNGRSKYKPEGLGDISAKHKIQYIPIFTQDAKEKARFFEPNRKYNPNNFSGMSKRFKGKPIAVNPIGWNKVVHYSNIKGQITV